ncbi:type II toxin-antitoxin system HicA family toxin [Nitrospira sp. MA-1]|nr:type II toxin-antitoxin system HicA family toxin [Nitrospira sp. MA-1]
MPPVPVLCPTAIVKTFQRLGWEVAPQRGSLIFMTKPGHLATLSIPDHSEGARGPQHAWLEPSGLRPSAQAWIPVDARVACGRHYLAHF